MANFDKFQDRVNQIANRIPQDGLTVGDWVTLPPVVVEHTVSAPSSSGFQTAVHDLGNLWTNSVPVWVQVPVLGGAGFVAYKLGKRVLKTLRRW